MSARPEGSDAPAFPLATEYRSDGALIQWAQPGVSKRELFAAMILQGWVTGPQHVSAAHAVDHAVTLADALIVRLAE